MSARFSEWPDRRHICVIDLFHFNQLPCNCVSWLILRCRFCFPRKANQARAAKEVTPHIQREPSKHRFLAFSGVWGKCHSATPHQISGWIGNRDPTQNVLRAYDFVTAGLNSGPPELHQHISCKTHTPCERLLLIIQT